ncbi:hypothetical protein [Gluconacetobacter tumulicola]|uniref:Uncharacterized protein n=1 Tax=Gluconacetobacter tumulicola TaxID=1017177 RepID=A0A7W4JHM3_9PROT|nr:hypothetical protein [Gluconacetobacter tumulicola]MBB2181202.1 hypothetical protein [Gluconacetobacter tumulicola]
MAIPPTARYAMVASIAAAVTTMVMDHLPNRTSHQKMGHPVNTVNVPTMATASDMKVGATNGQTQDLMRMGSKSGMDLTASAHSRNYLDVKDFGTTLNGSDDDATAFAAAKRNAKDGQNIVIPSGATMEVNLSAIPQGGNGKNNIWWLYGRTLANGSPLYAFGSDTVVSSINGGFWLHRENNKTGQGPVMRVDASFSSNGDVGTATQENCNVGPYNFSGEGVWCHQVIMNTRAQSGNQIADSASAFRNALSTQMWGRYTEARDETGLSSDKAGAMVGHEEDLYANDKDPDNVRILQQNMIQSYISSGFAERVGIGHLWGRNDDKAYFGTVAQVKVPWDTAGFDTSLAGPLVVTETLTDAATQGATTLSVKTTRNGISVGQLATGTGLSSETRVTAITDTSVTLSTGITQALAPGSTVTFTSDAPAYRLGNGQFVSFLSDNSIRLYANGSSHNFNTQIDGIVRLVLDTHGQLALSGDGIGNALPIGGNYVDALNTTRTTLSGNPVLMRTGQKIGWERSRTVTTGWSGSQLTDYYGSTAIRQINSSGNEILNGTVYPKNGSILPDMTKSEVLAIHHPQEGLMVNDSDDHIPVIYENGSWYPMRLGTALRK